MNNGATQQLVYGNLLKLSWTTQWKETQDANIGSIFCIRLSRAHFK